MARAVAVGEKHAIIGFKGVGFEILSLPDATRLPAQLSTLAKEPDVGLVVVTENMAAEAPDAIAEFRERSRAILTVIPSHEGSGHVSFQEIRKAVERSLGVDILGKNEDG